ncbi:MAG: hypothetical protein E6G51_09020 [Actinobacteria bacterium]|nr:MAG: hypothetical protein E6G51_09020 [Actinomycetota bacterium]
MSLEVAAIAVAIVAALIGGSIGAISLLRSDRRKGREESRRKGIEVFREARTSWDQAQFVEITESVRRAKLQETRASLVAVQQLVGSKTETKEFGQLLALLEEDPLADGGVNLATAKAIWPTVEKQIHTALAA